MHRAEQGSKTVGMTRALVLTLLAVSVAAGAHVFAGGSTPGPLTVVVVTLALTILCLPAGMVSFSVPRTAAALAVLQVAVHTSLSLAAMHGSAALPSAYASHHHGSPAAGSLGDQPVGAGMHHGVLPSVPMFLAHLGAALLLGLAVTVTERSWDLASRLPGAARRAATTAVPAPILWALATLVDHARTVLTGQPAGSSAADGTEHLGPSDLWSPARPARRGPPLLLRA